MLGDSMGEGAGEGAGDRTAAQYCEGQEKVLHREQQGGDDLDGAELGSGAEALQSRLCAVRLPAPASRSEGAGLSLVVEPSSVVDGEEEPSSVVDGGDETAGRPQQVSEGRQL
jgi:hypothetical protein